MIKRSLRNKKRGRHSRKNQLLYGGAQKYAITLHLNLENSDLEKILDPTTLSPEYLELLETHLKDLIPSNTDLDLKGTFRNRYIFNYNNKNKYFITFKIIVNYCSQNDEFTLDKIKDFIGLMTEMDASFTSEDDITYFITSDFDIKRDVELYKS